MIRAKYSDYPTDIPDENTEPSDGYLIYYGDDISASDTSVDFNNNLGILYIKAWGQNTDDTWQVQTHTGSEESREVQLAVFFGFALVMTSIATRTSYWILKMLAGFTWFAVAVYWKNNLPSGITLGSTVDNVVLVILGGIGVAMMLMPFWYTKPINGQEVGAGFKALRSRFFGGEEGEEEETHEVSREERLAAHRNRVTRAIHGRVERRRY
jgi:hypothetical protein